MANLFSNILYLKYLKCPWDGILVMGPQKQVNKGNKVIFDP